MKSAQLKIQQMAFMILAVLLFFVLVGLFFINFQFKDIRQGFSELQKKQTISALTVLADMPELNCDSGESFCLDEDKILIMTSNQYEKFWPVASIKVYKINPFAEKWVKCPASGCNYYEIYNSNQKNVKEYSIYVSICKKIKEFDYVYTKCQTGKLSAGVVENED